MNLTAVDEQIQALTESGFTAAAAALQVKRELARKLAIAYEHYRYVPNEAIETYRAKLKQATFRPATEQERQMSYYDFSGRYKHDGYHDDLVIVPLEKYTGIPPMDILLKVKNARTQQIFDGFTVASVEPVVSKIRLPDPIVFGRITGCTDHFFIGEWGTDVSISDLIGPHAG